LKKIIHLATCNTCQRIISEINPSSDVILQDIKTEPLTKEQVVAILYRKRGLNEQSLSEEDFKNLILEHYTFLKRPVMIVDNQIFVGNSKKVVAAAVEAFSKA